jgi:hypothetical protein
VFVFSSHSHWLSLHAYNIDEVLPPNADQKQIPMERPHGGGQAVRTTEYQFDTTDHVLVHIALHTSGVDSAQISHHVVAHVMLGNGVVQDLIFKNNSQNIVSEQCRLHGLYQVPMLLHCEDAASRSHNNVCFNK